MGQKSKADIDYLGKTAHIEGIPLKFKQNFLIAEQLNMEKFSPLNPALPKKP